MVYCKLIEKNAKTVRYALGGFVNDMTGELVIHRETNTYEIAKMPEKSKVYKVHIDRMLLMYAKDIKKGIFSEKMGYEI